MNWFALILISTIVLSSCSKYTQVTCPDIQQEKTNKRHLAYKNKPQFKIQKKSHKITERKDLQAIKTNETLIDDTEQIEEKAVYENFLASNDQQSANTLTSNYNLIQKDYSNNFSKKKQKIIAKELKKEYKKVSHSNGKEVASNDNAHGFAVASFVLGIIGVVFWGFLFGILAVIFGAIALSKMEKGDRGYGLAIAGLILGIVAVLVFVL